MVDEKTPKSAPESNANQTTPAPKADSSKGDSSQDDSSKGNTKPAAKASAKKKEKPPAVEDKPFPEFIQEHFFPSLQSALQEEGIDDIQLNLDQRPLTVIGIDDSEPYWHVQGQWQGGDRQFNIAFTKDDIKSSKVFYFADKGSQPSTIEQFMGDERRVNLDLMVMYTVQRLNAQKWLTRN
ncbi:MAG: DUF2996 domain-containing protein [Leptolyngbya sp. LCM1.Bin17]|nr:MAG: DUF2996 domain-containing protein [Leptolyngbya sp. LCM1.Bin17]